MTNIVYNKNGIPFDIDAIATDLNGKMDRDGLNATASVCVESYQNGSSWYRVYSDGWCEQGGEISPANSGQVDFLKPYNNINYYINGTRALRSDGISGHYSSFDTSKFQTYFKYYCENTTVNWKAEGYIT